jgi:TatD DNase family protein
MFIDTHAHLDAFEADAEGVPGAIARATEAGVGKILAIGGDLPRNRFALACAEAHAPTVRAAIGYDRDCADAQWSERLLREQLKDLTHIAAVGEIGLDFHYHPETARSQEALFVRMLTIAREERLPVVVHSRNAEARTIDILKEHVRMWAGPTDAIGALHCFTGDKDFARALLDTGIHISFSGIATFRNAASIREAASYVPDHRLLIETDSPYLAPVPHRGKRNEPAYLPAVATVLAEARGCTPADVERVTRENAEKLFGLA